MSFDQIISRLISRLPKHPEADKMRVVITECLATAEKFEAKRRELESKGHLTPHGRRCAVVDTLGKLRSGDLSRTKSLPF